ncbi:TRAP transporter large permease [Halobellus rarus]|uniref:TRAP transporter large permease n=1 Tax=Halobellus rarus TaxID=1126237 RepID=A0ABD6CRK7_9EURY
MIEYIPFLALLIVLIFMGIPIAWSLLISGSTGLIYVLGIERALPIFAGTTYGAVAQYTFSTIPMFLLMANFLSRSRITDDLFHAIQVWTGHIKGGLAMATTFANGGMAALSGSSAAAAATMSKIAVPEMRKYDYDDRLSMGTVSAAGTFAVMIPPSIALIVYGIYTDNSISALFAGGIIPGILTIISYICVIYIWGWVNPDAIGTVTEKATLNKRIKALGPIYPAVILIVFILGGIYGGVFTPTEAGALGAAGSLVVGTVFSGLRLPGISEAIEETLEVTVMIFMILLSALIFGRFLVLTGITPTLVSYIGDLAVSRWMIMSIILFIYLVLGTLISQSALLILTLPIAYPLVTNGLGYHPIWFGVVLVKTGEIGLVTPPLGLNVFISAGSVDVDVDIAFSGALRFVIADLVILAIMLGFPSTVTWLASSLG